MVIVATLIALLGVSATVVLASDSFSDVPSSSPFHDHINALVNAGITAGCGSGKYCPKNAVTREQMAVFMNRLGALSPGTLTTVDALSVNGIVPLFGSTTLTVPAATTTHCETLPSATGTEDFVAFVQLIETPSDPIEDHESWVDYTGVDPDEFKVCIEREDEATIDPGDHEVQIMTLEFIGQGVFGSSAGRARAEKARSASHK